jgi:hypothetical protein
MRPPAHVMLSSFVTFVLGGCVLRAAGTDWGWWVSGEV